MSVDVDAVNERLNGLVTLLKAVGVDSLGGGDNSDMNKVNGGLGSLPNAQQLDDDQIEAIIKKLQQAQAEAPQIIAALEAHAEARSLTGTQSRGGQSRSSRQQQHQPPPPEPEEDEDEEDDDEFDEDANYPMVGYGVSDDISVVSDLTTPTVVQDRNVPDEEHYRDTLPPMIVGGGGNDNAPAMIIAAPKRKNLVGAVRAGGPPRRAQGRGPGGAAAARRNKYQNTMAKLGEDDHGPAPRSRPMKPKPRPSGGNPSGSGQPVRKKKPAHSSSLRASPQHNEFAGDSWNAFENKPKVPNKAPTMIDNDGFLTAEGFDPFGSDANNPFKSSAGDLEFGHGGGRFSSNASASGFESFEGGRANPRKVKKKAPSMQSNFSAGAERKVRPAPGNGATSGGARRPRARRASLAM